MTKTNIRLRWSLYIWNIYIVSYIWYFSWPRDLCLTYNLITEFLMSCIFKMVHVNNVYMLHIYSIVSHDISLFDLGWPSHQGNWVFSGLYLMNRALPCELWKWFFAIFDFISTLFNFIIGEIFTWAVASHK